MTVTVTDICRYPIKSHGRESVASVTLEAGKTLPWDRAYAMAHDASRAGTGWARCIEFTRVAGSPAMAAITAKVDEEAGRITLTHPERAPLDFDPETEGDKLVAWVAGMTPANRPQPARLMRATGTGYTDIESGHVTICNMASHRAVEERLGQPLSPARWRGNIWLDGLPPWAEFDWLGREIRIGSATLRVLERTDRCMTTHANPETGQRDADVLGTLDTFGHRDFSVTAQVVKTGRVAIGDEVTLP
ncbi:MOSC domain-containing protein [Mesobacterium pallidum]|uniref:MOSC domain-containing protein n=1 Tax=Mesobacterium pallidum TaxID=2872037 RepID=UPI001EE279DC|nr:MOSC N-terminal beta barrel domain-containing protein [Mesobacterium pallidum]